jgi:PTS system D-glucosamine-specific IIA component/PTS system glucose-specific IIA component
MFEFFKSKSKKQNKIIAPISGKAIDLSEVPDEVFAQKMAGDGIAIDATGNIVVSPVDGKLTMIFETLHAFGITLDNGVELLVHIGLDTVELKSEGFKKLIEEGSYVKVGTPIIEIDREFILSKGFSLITPVLITNLEKVKNIDTITNKLVEAGKDEVILYY